MTRQLGNAAVLFDTELPEVFTWRPDMAGLRAATVPWALAVGEASAGKPYDRPTRVIADLAGVPVLGFPGGHTAYLQHPERFADRLATVLSGLAEDRGPIDPDDGG
jgi:pimeloyl-ACP methyl ester carboxylesterase